LLTKYQPVIELQVINEVKSGKRDAKEVHEIRCPICMCDLFEDPVDVGKIWTVKEIDDVVNKDMFDSVVLMSKCKDHLFHLECLEA
jgi:hypothetical protein